MEKVKELKLLKQALYDYRMSRIFKGFLFRKNRNTYDGFCHYFGCNKHIWHSTELPILNSLKPENMYNKLYWFKSGELLPRIKLLKKAIKIIKNELRKRHSN